MRGNPLLKWLVLPVLILIVVLERFRPDQRL